VNDPLLGMCSGSMTTRYLYVTTDLCVIEITQLGNSRRLKECKQGEVSFVINYLLFPAAHIRFQRIAWYSLCFADKHVAKSINYYAYDRLMILKSW